MLTCRDLQVVNSAISAEEKQYERSDMLDLLTDGVLVQSKDVKQTV